MFWKGFILLAFVLYINQLEAQLILTEGGVNYTINFDETMSGVNEAAYEGLGLHSEPISGELDSDSWIINGCSDGNTSFSGSYSSGDYARGISNEDESIGGLYAFDTGNNIALGWQSTASDMSPGEIILKVQNLSGFSIERLAFSYSLWTLNNEDRSQKITVAYSQDNSVYYPLPDSEMISPGAATNEEWQDSSYAFSIEFASLENTDFLFFKWRIEDHAGSGSRDEWALDDISLKIVNNTCLFEDWSVADGNLISNEGFELFGVNSFYSSPSNFASHSPAARFDDDLDQLTTPFILAPYSIKFWIKGQGNTSGSYLEVAGFNGSTWQSLLIVDPIPTSGSMMSINNLSAYQQFRFRYHKVNGNLAIDDIQISCGICELADMPSPATGSLSFSSSYCNQSVMTWDDMGSEYYLVLATEKENISNLPFDQFTYRSNTHYGLGEQIEDSVFVVYNGSSTAFLLQQLSSNTAYLLYVIPYNGLACEEHYSNSYVSATLTTPNCMECPSLIAAYVNPCETECLGDEGLNEMLFISSGAYTIPVDTASFKIYLENQSISFLNESMISNASKIDQLNALSDCPSLFIDALSVGSIPPESTVLLCHTQLCLEDVDKSAICQDPLIYVVFCESNDWNPNGELKNSGHLQQSIVLDHSALASACILQYSYIPNDIAQQDGAYITFSSQGGMNTNSFVLDQCNSEGTILPLTWGEIKLQKVDEALEISWKTLSELNNAGFSVERSANGNEFIAIAWVSSKGDGIFGHDYAVIDQNMASGLLYYRIKQVDLDGAFTYSDIVQIELASSLKVYQIDKTLVISGLEEKEYHIELLTANATTVMDDLIKGNEQVRIPIQYIKKGIYFLRIRSKEKLRVKKVFIN